MANFQSQPPAGRKLPSNWASMASSRAQQADQDYLFALQNAWRGNRDNETLIQSARLSNHPQPAPAAPPRRDSRTDASRNDGTMRLVFEDDEQQVWKDYSGALVTIKKRK
jgi:hypothetical protein